ncbi:DMT family transporter [Microbacterium lacticum]|uniref:Transporter family-2 protein n=1 Tax=Microbacterium lacticum TaxID=33885 RepID=A0A4Y3UPE6_9MICO|nr:DMT family transporter [Microbacterium lacticum]TQM98599.1 transporter family-2 protein [Microbacterium lacticum]GEB95230.1 membrane protein [Microbacterium lacticum]GGN22836.1 membrane protein [Microbacterium lacticum]
MTSPAPARLPAGVALTGAVIVGVLTALQARINGQLGLRLGDGFVAAAISFGSGLVLLIVLSAILPAGRRGFGRLRAGIRDRTIPWWMLAGGVAGAFTVATQGLAVAVIGVSLFTVGVVAGQTISGLVLDRAGYGPAGVVAITVPRLIGGLLALIAVGVSLQGGVLEQVPWWMLVMPVIAGVGIAWQQATNGRLRQRVGTPLTATLVNFIGGTTMLVIAAAVHVALVGAPAAFPVEPWLYLGGVIGVTYIFMSAALVVHTGVLLLGLGTVAGQLVTAFALDAVWPAAAAPGWTTELLMVVIAGAGVVIAAAPGARRGRPAR